MNKYCFPSTTNKSVSVNCLSLNNGLKSGNSIEEILNYELILEIKIKNPTLKCTT